jgi:type I restriction-modification system DNA methylase subunit
MRKSLGSKRKELSDEHIAEITRLFGSFMEDSKDGAPTRSNSPVVFSQYIRDRQHLKHRPTASRMPSDRDKAVGQWHLRKRILFRTWYARYNPRHL